MEKELQNLEALTEIIDGKMVAIASSERKDRVGDTLKVENWDFTNFKKNPVLQAAHDYKPQFTIGVAENLRIEGKKVLFEPKFHTITQLAREIKEMFEQGILKAWSVGFIPGREEGEKNELLEISAVAVPANAEALVIAKGMNPDEELQVKEKIEEWKLKELGSEEFDTEEKPYPNEHACRLEDPGKCDKFRRVNNARDHNGKKYDVIYGHMKSEDKWVDQAFRYDKGKWSAGDAKSHCSSHKGSFEAASKSTEEIEEIEIKGAIPYSVHGDGAKADEGDSWDAGVEIKKASGDAGKLKKMHTWVDSGADGFDASERKWYKLPHHKGDGGQAVVWRGVAAAMGALLGARGGVDIPADDKTGVYNHLAKHYKQFDKEAPEMKEYQIEDLVKMHCREQIILPRFMHLTDEDFRKAREFFDGIDKSIETLNEINTKEGRVLSGKNRKIINDAITTTKDAIVALEKLLEMTETPTATSEKVEEIIEEKKCGKPKRKISAEEIAIKLLQRINKESSIGLRDIKKY